MDLIFINNFYITSYKNGKKTKIIIIGIIALVVISVAVILTLSATGVFPNWFGLHKQSSAPETDKLLGAYSMSVDVELPPTEYQIIIDNPVKQTTFVNNIRSNMATKLGFDEQTAKDRIIVALIKKEPFRKKETYQAVKNTIKTEVLIIRDPKAENPIKELNN